MSFFTKKEKRSTYDYYSSPCFTGGISNHVVDVGNIRSMNVSAVYAATTLISNSIAILPITVTTHNENKRLVLDDHNIYHMFDNTVMTKFTTIKTMMMDLLLTGNAYAIINRKGDDVVSLKYVSPVQVEIVYNELSDELYYNVTIKNVRKKLMPKDIIHLNINAVDGVHGRGILYFAANAINLAKKTEKTADKFFGSACITHGILTTDSPRIDEKQIKQMNDRWRNSQRDDDGTGITILEAGMHYQQIQPNSADAQMLETRIYNVQDICRFFNISPIMLGEYSHTQYGSIEQAHIEFVQHCLMPYTEMIENEFDRKLLRSDINLHINFDTNVLLKSDKKSEAAYIQILVTNGILTPNEGRAILGYNAIEGGDRIMVAFTDVEQNTVAEQDES